MSWLQPREKNHHASIERVSPRLHGPRHLLGRGKASFWHGSDLHGVRPAKRPATLASLAAGTLKTEEQIAQPASGEEDKPQRWLHNHFCPFDILPWNSCLKKTHFKRPWCHITAAAQPHLLYEVCVGLGDLAPHSQWILTVNLCLVLVIQEVLCEGRCIAQALEAEGKFKTS